MHVLVATHDFYPDSGSGGTGRYVYETTRRLVERGHRVSVITRRRGDAPHQETVDGIAVRRYDISIANQAITDIFPQLSDAYRTVRQFVSDLVSDEPPDLLSFQGPVTSLFVDRAVDPTIPRICTFHSPWPTEYEIRTRNESLYEPRRRLNVQTRRFLEGHLLSKTDGTITLSEFMRNELQRVYGLDLDTTIIPGGVNGNRFSPEAGSFDAMNAGDPIFLTVRRLTPRMGHELLLEAFASVVENCPDARLYIAGDGPLRETLERKTTSLRIDDRTTFLGYVPDSDLPSAYATADLFVLPTTELEGFGLATLEALASGTPVIGTPIGGTVEVLGDLADNPEIPAGVLASSADSSAFARRMLEWASLSADERTVAGQVCRMYANRRFTWEQTAATLESYYANYI